LLQAGDRRAVGALAEFAERFPDDSDAPVALFLIGDWLDDRNDAEGASRWYGTLMDRYPGDARASVARFRLAARSMQRGAPDSAAALYRAEVEADGTQQASARFWLGKLARQRGDTVLARAMWTELAREDSVGYYGLRARREAGLAPPVIPDPVRPPTPPGVAAALARIDTLLLAGLDSAARAEVRDVVARPPDDLLDLLAWSEGLMARGWGPAAIRLAWQAYARAPGESRSLRAIYPWPNRSAVEAEAAEFGVDPVLLASLVRQESVFDPDALSPAGARGLAQLLVSTAAQLARGLDVAFAPAWLAVPDLNLHLGAAHLAALLRQFDGRVEAALAAYNAGGRPARRWLGRPGADDPDQYVEGITYAETRGYVRAVLRNRELYEAMHVAAR
jgi:soluble lytic murein transglycosylase